MFKRRAAARDILQVNLEIYSPDDRNEVLATLIDTDDGDAGGAMLVASNEIEIDPI